MQHRRVSATARAHSLALAGVVVLCLSVLVGAHVSAATAQPRPVSNVRPWLDAQEPVAMRVRQLLAQMTLDEKVQLMYGVARPRGVHSVGYVPGIARLGVPPLVLSDGPVGVKDSCFGEQYPDNCLLGKSTAMPATVSLAASFDPSLSYDYGRVVGSEARARGVDVLYGPAMDIVRVPQGGRNFEYFSEDPYLTGQLAASWVHGLQSQDVAAQAKHYAMNNQENDRHGSTSNADERTIREIYLPAWQQVTAEGGADSVMCANNMVNGTYNCENTQLLGETLKGEWGWDGVVGSDYAATNSALGSVNAGLDQAFTGLDWGKWYSQLPDLVRSGQVSEQIIDEHVLRILTMMIKLGMFDTGRSTGAVDVTADGAVSRAVAEQGAVLLKNDQTLLPLDAAKLRSIAVIGQYADTAMTGGGGSSKVDPYYSVSPVQGIRDRLGSGVDVTTADGKDLTQAAGLAANADVAVVVVNDKEQEGSDRADINLPGIQDQLISAVQAANPNTVVVLNTGSAVTMPWISQVHALLEMWYPGEEDGNALAALLFGDVDPSGKLPVTFPVNAAQDCCNTPPRYPEQDHAYAYTEGLQVGYRWYDAQHLDPLFPFGFGLSYTSFHVDDLVVTPSTVNAGHDIQVSLRVTNTGRRAGTETPQVYLGFPSAVGEPPHRLVATARVTLAPGQSKRVSTSIPRQAYSYWDTAAHNWDIAPGDYTVSVGTSSRDLQLTDTFRVAHADGAQGIDVRAADTIASGTSSDVTVTVTNTSDETLTNPGYRLDVPYGWTATPIGSTPVQIRAHGSADLVYRVTAPTGAGPGTYTLTARTTWSGPAAGSATRAVTIRAA